MALTLENGEGLSDSDSLVSLGDVRDFAVSRGKSLTDDDAELEAAIRTAHDYLLNKEPQLKGERTKEGQALPFPRKNVELFGFPVDWNAIPKQVKDAICLLVIEQVDKELLPAADGRVVQSEAVGPISTTYAASGTVAANPIFPRVEAFLKPLIRGGGILRTERA